MLRTLICAAILMAPLWPPTADARDPAAREAKHVCKQAARAQYGASGFDNVTAGNLGYGQFEVHGTMFRRSGQSTVFRCRTNRGELSQLVVEGDSSGDAGAALGAALGIAVGAAIIGAISSDHSHDDYRAPATGQDYGRARGYSPVANITCYRRQRACYHVSGRFAPRWTEREFGAATHLPSQPARPSRPRIDRQAMRRYCLGEAAGRFHTRPRYVEVYEIERDQRGGFFTYGQTPPTGRRITQFRCDFDSVGRFLRLRRT